MKMAATPEKLAATPEKERKIDCCLCKSQNSRILKVNGRKLSSENFNRELGSLLHDNDLVSKLKITDAGFCRSCHAKVKGTFDFVNHIKSSLQSFLDVPNHCKRATFSPLTPKSLKAYKVLNPSPNSEKSVPMTKSRKRLKVETSESSLSSDNVTHCQDTSATFPTEHAEHCTTSSTVPDGERTQTSEHGYATSEKTGSALQPEHSYSSHHSPDIGRESSTDPVIQLIQSVWDSIVQDNKENVSAVDTTSDVFRKLRYQSRTLMSRTTMLASVLFKHRDAITLVENADHFLQDIISEMSNR
jgi:hypothetical protein